jgi:hypothetical protein
VIRKRLRRDGAPSPRREPSITPLFNLEELHERRIHSWSPELHDDETLIAEEPEDERDDQDEPVAAAPERTLPAAPTRVQPAPSPPRARPVAPARTTPVPARTAAADPAEDDATEEDGAGDRAAVEHLSTERRRRGRPRGRPRRQVHFHVDPDEEVLLLGAVEKFGSQQKGLIAALQALHDIEVVRDEVERLAAECENQRRLLDQAESLFNR